MDKQQKILVIIFIILFFVLIFEIIYLFYYQPNQKESTSIKIVPTKTIESTDIVGSIFLPSKVESGQRIKEMITKEELKGKNFASYLSILNGLNQEEDCIFNEKKCFKLENKDEEFWKADSDKDFPIKINGPFIIRLNFNGNRIPSGISFNGRLPKSNKNWWEGLITVFFGVGEEGKRLYIDAKNNNKEPFLLYDKTFDKKLEEIYILFDQEGKNILLTDLAFNEIAFIDINKITNNKFPQGLFPDKQFYIGYAIAPLSDLVVYDLSIL